jgi:hypothetical protein
MSGLVLVEFGSFFDWINWVVIGGDLEKVSKKKKSFRKLDISPK